MSRVLLVNPPFYRFLGSHYNANSLGIAYIASHLNSNGHDAWVYNADFVNRDSYSNLGDLFSQYADYKEFFKNEDADIWNEVVDKIIDFQPDWVGYTSYTANISSIDIISRKLKQRYPKVKQVIGGVHATLDTRVLESVPAVDFAVRREGEFAMLDLAEGKDPGSISGVASRSSFNILSPGLADVNQQIDDLVFPERDKFWGLTEEEKRTVDVSYICSIRGCPYRCNYCASPSHWGRDKTQFRTPNSVLSEMKHLKENYWDTNKEFDYSASANAEAKGNLIIKDNTIVYFVDDVFTVRKRRVKEILRGIVDQGLGMDWKCEARTDHLDEEICELMAQAGCVRVKLGFESGSDRILSQIQKDETKEEMKRGAKMLKEAGVPFTAYFMAGFPGETDDDLRETIKFAEEIDADYYSLSVLSPYYGTKMYFDLMAKGHELDKQPWEYFYHQTGDLMVNDTITRGVLDEYLSLNELNTNKDLTGTTGYM
jgi:anaerobic magnesium-protoporphyrin IX monomethyl ester cyclase